VLVSALAVSFVIGRLIATVLRGVVVSIGRQADKSENLHTVNRLRRYETYIVLSIALIRTFLVIFALYFWWVFTHPTGQAPAIIGASALAVIVFSGAISPVLRDIATGSFMMAEQWYGVGDHVRVEPFADVQGVVERVTLRSTRIRGLTGEIIWINNQNIQGVRVSPRGIRTLALEMFVKDLTAGKQLIALTNQRLPIGPLLVVSPLEIISAEKVGDSLWHLTAVSETAPGREWLIEQSAVELLKSLDEQRKQPVLSHGPLARYADSEAERRFARTIRNARKQAPPKHLTSQKRPRGQ
jgi:moderate conductance mechanosensitive channel